MLSEEHILEIKILSQRYGKSIRAIAAELGISRNTVRRYLRGEGPTARPSGRGPGRPRSLERYEAYLTERVTKAAPHRVPATVLTREVAAMGYTGSERTVRRFVAALYQDAQPEPTPVERFETLPGQQIQMDWAEERLDGRKVYCFIGLLGYSRALYVEYVDSMKSSVLIACHERMLIAFGGAPNEILYDNMKTVVCARDAYGRTKHRFQNDLYELAKRHGFLPRLCRPYRPQTKGKVERSVHYIRHSFFVPLMTRLALDGITPDLQRLNAEARHWCDAVANRRIHGTTGEVPAMRLLEERAHLSSLGAQPPVLTVHSADGSPVRRWPRERIQRSPKYYDTVLSEALS
ncbi:MAG: IS21 family transposase [Pseudomonadota bacterium]